MRVTGVDGFESEWWLLEDEMCLIWSHEVGFDVNRGYWSNGFRNDVLYPNDEGLNYLCC